MYIINIKNSDLPTEVTIIIGFKCTPRIKSGINKLN